MADKIAGVVKGKMNLVAYLFAFRLRFEEATQMYLTPSLLERYMMQIHAIPLFWQSKYVEIYCTGSWQLQAAGQLKVKTLRYRGSYFFSKSRPFQQCLTTERS